MKKIIVLILSVYLITFYSCKKSSSSPSIIGSWVFTNISGTSIDYEYATTNSDTTTYSYNSANNTYTEYEVSHTSIFPNRTTTNAYQITSEVWTFNANGTYSINEAYTENSNATVQSSVDTAGGIWEYLSNTQTDNSFILTGEVSNALPNINNGIYEIESVNGNTLILTLINSYNDSLGLNNNNITITFTKHK